MTFPVFLNSCEELLLCLFITPLAGDIACAAQLSFSAIQTNAFHIEKHIMKEFIDTTIGITVEMTLI
jgi:hypothetical protein